MKKILSTSLTFAVIYLLTPATVFAQRMQYDYDAWEASAANEGAVAGLGVLWICVMCCFILIPLAINIGVSYLIYKDAEKNNVDSPILWAVLSFLFNLPVWLIYFFLIRKQK